MMDSKEKINVLISREEVEAKAAEIGAQISKDYEGESVYLICTLRGAIMWMSELMKNITCDAEIDFIQASSYGTSQTSSGVVKIKKDLEGEIYNKNVIIVEDIIDTGNTLKLLKDYLMDRNPKSLKICSLLDKPSRRETDVEGEYVGFKIENLFVVGFGLDFAQKYRNLPYVGYIEA